MLANSFYVVPGATTDSVVLRFEWTHRDAGFNNEIGVYKVQDANGLVNNIAANAAGYANAALAASQVVFSSGQKAGARRDLTFNGGDRLAFVLVQNRSIAAQRASNPQNAANGGPLAFFSVDGANPDRFDHVRPTALANNATSFAWEDLAGGGDRDFNDVVFRVGPTAAGGFRAPTAAPQRATFTLLSREAAFANEVGLFLVQDGAGRIDNLLPGDAGYLQAALANGRRQMLFAPSHGAGATATRNLSAGEFFGMYLISNGTSDQFVSGTAPTGKNAPRAFLSFAAANADGFDHFRPLNATDFGIEDKSGGGDQDFDDVVVRLTFAPTTPPGPTITAALSNDTGRDGTNTDGITSDPAIAGAVNSTNGVKRLLFGFDDTPEAQFTDVTADLTATDTFAFTLARLQALGGTAHPLNDGAHTVRLKAVDDNDVNSQVFSLNFTLDRTGPALAFNLDSTTDSAIIGDLTTNGGTVSLTGTTAASSRVTLVGGTATAVADANGRFTVAGVTLVAGDNSIRLRSVDVAGNATELTRTITRNSAPTLVAPIADVSLNSQNNSANIDLKAAFDDSVLRGTVVRVATSLGDFDVQLFNDATPLTVQNFLNYVNGGDFANTVIHRAPQNFVVQGGGFKLSQTDPKLTSVTTDPPVQNEPGISNTRSTIAMAKLGGDPNSATSQWFVNQANNAANLDNQNGGFTAFGRVVGNGMETIDAINAVPKFSPNGPSGAFADIPLRNLPANPNLTNFPTNISADAFIAVTGVQTVAGSDGLLYSLVSNTNPQLVVVQVVNGVLNIGHVAGATGSATITVRAVDPEGLFVEDTFVVNVG